MQILAIDPGETSAFLTAVVATSQVPGMAVVNHGAWQGIGQLKVVADHSLFYADQLVVEDYRVYSHKAKQHIGSQVYTAREIGRIEWLAYHAGTPITYQMASQAKQAWPNSRMKMYPMVREFVTKLKGHPQRKHILDAYRHLLTFIERSEKLGLGLSVLETENER